MVKDDPLSDHHLGDAHFQSVLYGFVNDFIILMKQLMSHWYLDGKVHDFPTELLEKLYTSKSSYLFSELLKTINQYYTKPKKRTGPVPEHPTVRQIVFSHVDDVWVQINELRKLPYDEQQQFIYMGLMGQTNCGFDATSRQTKKTVEGTGEIVSNFGKVLWLPFVQQWLPDTYAKWRKILRENDIYITVDMIFDAITEAEKKELYFPYIGFKRTQLGRLGVTKHRAVYGGFILLKALGAIWKSAKDIAKKEIGIRQFGKMDWVAWKDWDDLFPRILEKIPYIDEDGNVLPQSKSELISLYGDRAEGLSEGEHIVEVYGEDFSGYDQSIIYEDLAWITKHKKAGWIFNYVLNTLINSEVWIGNLRLSNIFFKSGHPFTSLFGSIIHLGVMCNAADYMNAHLLSACVLSDDNLGWWVNFNEEAYIDYCDSLGLEIKSEASSKFSRDKMVIFLKNLVGYVLSDGSRQFMGDPVSRYLGLVHSENPQSGDRIVPERDSWVITGDAELDALLSKLASFAAPGAPFVLAILKAVSSTQLGMRTVMFLHNPRFEAAQPYRTDLAVGFHPSWLEGIRPPMIETLSQS
jgi:hypothetical protein